MGSAETKKTKKLSRRQKAKARKTLETAFHSVLNEVSKDGFLRNYLFLEKEDGENLKVGSYAVHKTKVGLFNVVNKKNNKPLYNNLYSFNAAMAIVEALNTKKKSRLQKIIKAEEEYCKNVNEMRLFKHMYEVSRSEEPESRFIYEDRYAIVRQRALNALKEIKRLRIVA